MSFRDNLDFEDRLARQVVFNSSLSSASIHATVNALNTFAQNALEFFRGYIQLSLVDRPYQAPPRLAQGARRDKNQDGGFLCELPLTLPKVETFFCYRFCSLFYSQFTEILYYLN